MGADNFYATADPETLKNLKGYFDLIINTLPVEIDWDQYLNLLAVEGTMAVVGAPEKKH
jgi:alcohol dehydrogenase (NADP+)